MDVKYRNKEKGKVVIERQTAVASKNSQVPDILTHRKYLEKMVGYMLFLRSLIESIKPVTNQRSLDNIEHACHYEVTVIIRINQVVFRHV